MVDRLAFLKDHGELCLLSTGRRDSWFNPRSSSKEGQERESLAKLMGYSGWDENDVG